MLRDIFQVPHHHSQVSGAIDAIIEIGQELLASSARVLWLTWPMRTACLHMPPNDPRVNTARAIIAEYAYVMIGKFQALADRQVSRVF